MTTLLQAQLIDCPSLSQLGMDGSAQAAHQFGLLPHFSCFGRSSCLLTPAAVWLCSQSRAMLLMWLHQGASRLNGQLLT